MSTPWPNEAFVHLKHNGDDAWVIVHQNGQQLGHTVDIGPDDPAAARRWLREQATDTTWPADSVQDADMYALDRYDEQLVARPIGGFRHDERGWTVTDSTGRSTHVNADIDEDRYDDAVEWAHQIHTSQPDYQPPGSSARAMGGRYFDYYPSADSGAA